MTCDTCKANKVCNHDKYGFETCESYISADCVEIIRCKDCEHASGTKLKCSMFDDIQMEKNHYCSYGERKQ